MLIALSIVSPLLLLSLVANIWLFVNGRSWKDACRLSWDEQDALAGLLDGALSKVEDLEAELLMAEDELGEMQEAAGDLADENDDILAAVADYMARVESATDDLGDALAVATGAGGMCQDCCCNGTH